MNIPIGTITAGTIQTNPTTATVLVTTGNLAAGFYLFQYIITTSASAMFNIELLDAADAVIQTIVIRTLANTSNSIPMCGAIQLQTNYEMRVRPQANITGTVASTILACPIMT